MSQKTSFPGALRRRSSEGREGLEVAFLPAEPDRIGRVFFLELKEAKMRIACSLLILSWLFSFSANAQEEKEPVVSETREEIIVTADRLEESVENSGSSVTVITCQQIEKRNSPFVTDLLRSVPGLHFNQAGTFGKVTTLFLRGAGSDQSLILIDGVQINDSLGFVDFSTLSTSNIERIEIVRGPQSTLYGSDAMGGVVNILTRTARDPEFGLLAETGSDSTFLGAVRAGAGSERNNILLEYQTLNSDGETQNDHYQNGTFSLNGHIMVTEATQFGILYRRSDTEVGIPFNFGLPSPQRRQDTESNLIHFPIRQQIRDWWNAEFHISVFDQTLHFEDPTDPFGFTFSDSESRTTTFQVFNTWELRKQHKVIAGYEHETIDASERSSFGVSLDNEEVSTNAFFAQYQMAWEKKATITAGFRLDDHSAFGSNVSPRLAVSYLINDFVRIHSAVGAGFRAPRPAELVGPFGNPALQPEEVFSRDTGVSLNLLDSRISLDATYFSNDFDQLITFDLSTFRLRNFQEVKTSGLELQGNTRITENWNIGASYTYLDTENETSGEELLRRPRHSGSFTLDYRQKILGIHFSWRYVGERFDIDELTFSRVLNESYHTADVVVSFDFGSWVPYLRITNAFDNEYQDIFGYPASDRGVFAGIKLNY